MPDSDIVIREVQYFFSDEKAREPLKFGAVVVDEATYCHVRVRVENRKGRSAVGWGAIFLVDFWAFPSKVVEHTQRDKAMRLCVEKLCALAQDRGEFGHPIDLYLPIEEKLPEVGAEITQEMGLAEPFPFLAGLVCGSPIDAALHDAFGIANGISSYDGYAPPYMVRDLGAYLGPELKGRHLGDFVQPRFASPLPAFHLVGGLDYLRAADVPATAPKDGLPNSLDRWIERDGLSCLKVKLRGTDLDWDVSRLLEVHRIAREVQDVQRRTDLYMSADTNEQCEHPDYIIEMLEKVREADHRAFDAILYIEQPTERDLNAQRHDMRKLAAIKPVIIDESLMTFDDFNLCVELGWSGIALKSCKGHSMALLFAAKAEHLGLPYTVQDLTNPGISLIHSAGLAARLRPMKGVESNSRQYFPETSAPEQDVHPGVFTLLDGSMNLNTLGNTGLGYRVEAIKRDTFQETP